MIRVCGWCHRLLGLKAPYLDFRKTHGICPRCAEGIQRKVYPVVKEPKL